MRGPHPSARTPIDRLDVIDMICWKAGFIDDDDDDASDSRRQMYNMMSVLDARYLLREAFHHHNIDALRRLPLDILSCSLAILAQSVNQSPGVTNLVLVNFSWTERERKRSEELSTKGASIYHAKTTRCALITNKNTTIEHIVLYLTHTFYTISNNIDQVK